MHLAMDTFTTREYLLHRYGLRMNKKEVCFESKKSRATIDNMRNHKHRRFDPVLARAQVDSGLGNDGGTPVLFRTPVIAEWIDGMQ